MIRKYFFVLLLTFLALFLCWANYSPGTYLSGWDTLHPEFNFGEYFKRTFFGVWQEHQGLGAVAAQSHAGELPRLLIYYPLSLVFPIDFIRWSYFFLTLIAGPLGVYFFLRYILKKDWVAFCGGLFYLLNLGTLQHYYLPLEMFATHFATLPWLFLFLVKFLQHGKRRDLLLFSLVTLFATPISHTPTLFYVYFLALGIFLLTNILIDRQKILRSLLILFITLTINAFWLMPNIYFVINHGQDVSDSKAHSQLFNRAFYTSKEFATIEDAAVIKGFLFDWGQYDHDQKTFVYLFSEWIDHLNNPIVKLLGYLFFAVSVAGIIVAFIQRNKVGIALLPIFALSFFAIASNLEILSSITLLRESMRFHFTKFSILLMFSMASFFGIALEFLTSKLKKIALGEEFLIAMLTTTIGASLIYYMLPAFNGNLISVSEKVNFPKEYFQAFDFLNSQKTGRIAKLPMNTYWGWDYYKWKYEGAGFLWFGLNSPLLDREFDRWFPYNENFYWEASYAIYSKNLKLFEDVLAKYQVNFLFLDGNIFSPSSPKSIYLDEIKEMIAKSSKISKAKSFGNIEIYKVDTGIPVENFVFLAQNLPTIEPQYRWTNLDKGFEQNGSYLSSPEPKIYYPFRSLFTGRSQKDLEFNVEEQKEYFIFKNPLFKGDEDYYLDVPKINDQDLVWVDPQNLNKVKNLYQDIYFDGKVVGVKIPKTGGYFSAEIKDLSKREFILPNLPHNLAYLIVIDSKNTKGKPLNFWIENLTSRRADLETYLSQGISYFIQPPVEEDGLGYTLHFDDTKIGNEKSENELNRIEVYPIPFDFLTNLKLKKDNIINIPNLVSVSVDHPNPSIYFVNNPNLANSTLVLSQAFEKGWKAYQVDCQTLSFKCQFFAPFFGKEIKDHVLFNNWANAWNLQDSSSKIIIIFIPQYFEFLGMGLIIMPFLFVFKKVY